MDDAYDVIVVGLGGMGSAAAYQLARRGMRVLGIEQFTPAHALGSSHGGSRIVRKAYFEGPSYVPLLTRAYELWDELSAEFGEQLFTRTGALMIGAPDSAVVAGTLASAERWRLPHEYLDAAALAERYPQFELYPGQVAVFEADAGFARPEATVLAQLELAGELGAELWFDTVVESIELGPDGVHVDAGGEAVSAPRLVLATGAWADRLANLDQFPLSVTRQSVHWFGTSQPAAFEPARFPVYLWDIPGPADVQLYGFPQLAGEAGVKAAIYRDGRELEVDPDRLDRELTPADTEPVARLVRSGLPELDGPLVSSSVCMYAGVEGDDFVLGLHPGGAGKVVLAIGFSGHGFKFVPVVGEIVADLVQHGRSRLELDFLSPQRFRR